MDGEIEMRRRPLVILIVIAVVLVGVIIWIGNWAINRPAQPSPTGLTEAEKEAILESLRQPSGVPELTTEQRAEILKSLQRPSTAPELTPAEKATIVESLR